MSPVGDGWLLEGQEADEGRAADGEEDLLLGAEGEDGGPAVAQGAAEGDELHQAEADHNLMEDLDDDPGGGDDDAGGGDGHESGRNCDEQG